jgi:predicted RNA-binding Zn-ribbon protein involved in translation (DUF1610 family)
MLTGEANDMLQMNCSNCGGLIKSPHLAEVQIFLCPQCEEIVVVEDVVISTEKTPFDLRSSLKNLLFAAREKFQRNKSENLELQTKYEINKRLAKLLKRDDFRLNLSRDFFVQIGFGRDKRSARLLNISSTGAAIDIFDLGQLPDKDSETKFQLQLPGQEEPSSLLARVIWSGKPENIPVSPTITMGLQFKDMDEETRACLWDFIVNAETSTHT